MTEPLLSICAPTHNGRGREIGDLIARVVDQVGPELAGKVEICISDGASRDGTDAIVERGREQERVPIRYRRSDPDRGFVAHQRESVEMAAAPYCWLMSSDDAPAPGSVARVLDLLAANPGVAGIVVAFDVTDPALKTIVKSPTHELILPPDPETPRRLTEREEILAHLGMAIVSLSAQIVDRDAWLAAAAARSRVGPVSPLFGHMQFIGGMFDLGRPWLWCPDRLLLIRGENDSWGPGHFGDEIALYWTTCIGQLAEVYAELCGRWSPAYRLIMRRWRELAGGPQSLLTMKMQTDPPPTLARDLRLLVTFTRAFASDPAFWRRSLPVLLLPHQLAPRVQTRVAANAA